jgi:hypothetical protein
MFSIQIIYKTKYKFGKSRRFSRRVTFLNLELVTLENVVNCNPWTETYYWCRHVGQTKELRTVFTIVVYEYRQDTHQRQKDSMEVTDCSWTRILSVSELSMRFRLKMATRS